MCLPVFIFYLWLNLEYHCLSPFTHYAVNILVCWCFSEDRNPWKTLGSCQLLQQAVGGVFLCTLKLRPAGHRVFLATHTTKRSHRPREPLPGQLALSWWQRRLSRNQSEPCLPAAPFHRFMDACVYVRGGKSLFLPDPSLPWFACVCVRMCMKHHAEGSADLIFPRITNEKAEDLWAITISRWKQVVEESTSCLRN